MSSVRNFQYFCISFLPYLASAFLIANPRQIPETLCSKVQPSLSLLRASRIDLLHMLRGDSLTEEPVDGDESRRQAIARITLIVLAASVLPSDSAWAAGDTPFGGIQSQFQAESTELGAGLLESRVTENLLSPPSYGMETTDIFYPDWFKGVWQATSTTKDVQAPCGTTLFGGNATFERARNEIGTTLNYDARFVSDGANHIIADREYNVRSIAKAAMGAYSVLDIPVATPNKLTCVLAPNGSPQLLKVDLIALNRRQESISDLKFDCSEVTREIVAPVINSGNPQPVSAGSTGNSAPILKEVETTSLYTYDPATNQITCKQRSATFLLPSQSSPMAYKMWEASRGRPIDVRFYGVKYYKQK